MKTVIYKYPLGFSVAWVLVIFILCATPGQYIPSVNWLELLSFDKFVHATTFFILCTLLFTINIKHNRGRVWMFLYFATAIAYGVSLEFMQAKIFSNRSYDVLDISANSFGCIVALFFYGRLKAWYKVPDII